MQKPTLVIKRKRKSRVGKRLLVWSYDDATDSYSGIADSSYANLKLGAKTKHERALNRYQDIGAAAMVMFESHCSKAEVMRRLGISRATLYRALSVYRVPNRTDPTTDPLLE
jgi:DNA-binding NtrC family response regulator